MIDISPKLVLEIMNDCARSGDRLRHLRATEAVE